MINILEPDFSDSPGSRPVPRNYRRSDIVSAKIDLSVITPYYNTGEIFMETFVSLQSQSYQNWEWIIVDDGSPDQEAVKRLERIEKSDERIKVIHQENGGTAAARNTGFRSAQGRYICLLDHDDMLEPTYLEKCIWFLDSHPEFAFCNSYNVFFGEQNFLWTSGFEKREKYLEVNSAPPISVIRRTAWEECGGFDDTIRVLYEDWDFWLSMANKGHWGYTIPEFLQWYRKLEHGRHEQILQSGHELEEFAKTMRNKYPNLYNHFPHPTRHFTQPYDSIETKSLVTNPLIKNQGRRVMFIVPWMVTGGADRVNLDLIEGLTSKGHDVTICATLLTDHCWEYLYTQLTPDVFILPNFLSASDYPRFLTYLIQSRQIDTVIITGSTIGYQLLPYLRAANSDVAFVDMCHVEEPHWLNGGHPRFSVGYQDVLDLNIVTTKHLAKWMQERGADGTRIKTMYSYVRPAETIHLINVGQIRMELDIPADMPVIVFAGRICEQKRPTMVANILKALQEYGLIFKALIVGDGEQRGKLKKLIDQYHLTGNVQMLGAVSHQRWLEILIASEIFLMPSQYEGISIALLEAMAAGVIPVVAKVGGHEEIVHKDVGVLIPHGVNEVQEYLDAIRQLLCHPEKMQTMSKQCQELAASKFLWEDMIDTFLALLDLAHQYKIDQPRNPISLNFGLELALQSFEPKMLGGQSAAIERLRDMDVPLITDSIVNAAEECDFEMVGLLIEAGVDANAEDIRGNTALIQSCWKGDKKMVKFLLDKNVDVNGLSSSGLSPLHSAVANKQHEVVSVLLDHGADPNEIDPQGSNPLIIASWLGDYETVKVLLLAGAQPNYRRTSDGLTPLQVANLGNHARIAHLLKVVWATE